MLELIRMNEDHLEKIMKWRMMPEVTKYMYTDPHLTMSDQKQWYNKVKNDPSFSFWVIKLDGVDIGLINLYEIDKKNKRCSWAYYIGDTSFRGRGIARMLECNMYDYVFDVLELNKLSCEVFSFNEKVIQIHEKFGSLIEGEYKDHIYKNNQFHNVVAMAITKSRWNEIKGQYKYDKISIER